MIRFQYGAAALTRNGLLLACLAVCGAGCNYFSKPGGASSKQAAVSNPPSTAGKDMHMARVSLSPFGTTKDGKAVTLYTLTNTHGIIAKIADYGATLIEMHTPDRMGKMGDIVLGFDNITDYENKSPFFGATAGRVANRIAKAEFELDGETYQLVINNGPNTLHGGKIGFDKKVWDSKVINTPEGATVEFHYLSPDMEENFPGNLDVTLTYTLTNDNALRLDYKATTDKKTILNLTNHSYWNLSAMKSSTILDEFMYINANSYTPVDDVQIPTGHIAPVLKTVFDFRAPTRIGERIEQVPGAPPKGYDHNYVLNGEPGKLKLCAKAEDSDSGRQLEIWTTEPGVQFYTGNFLDGSIVGKNHKRYGIHAGFCLECQHYPDSIHQPDFPTTVLKPGETYRQTTIHKFLVH